MERTLDAWAARIAGDEAFAAWHYRTASQASMGGQLMVIDIEGMEEPDAKAAPNGAPRLRDFTESFFGLPFEDALKYFTEREVMTPEEFYALQGRFRAGGFTAARLTSEAMRTRAQQVIEQLLRGQYSIAEASQILLGEAILDEAERGAIPTLGLTAESSAAVETIVRTNAATAYGQGRWQAMSSPTIQALRPYMQLLCVSDTRTRENHRVLDGKVFRIDSAEAAYYATPLGFNCRCSSRTLSDAQMTRFNGVLSEGRIPGGTPDPGWEGPPEPLSD